MSTITNCKLQDFSGFFRIFIVYIIGRNKECEAVQVKESALLQVLLDSSPVIVLWFTYFSIALTRAHYIFAHKLCTRICSGKKKSWN